MRLTCLASIVLFGLAACSDDQPTASPKTAAAPAATATPTSQLEARINMGPVDPTKAKALMHDRHEKMEKIRDHFRDSKRLLDGGSPDMAKVAAAAAAIDGLAQQAGNWFPAGTGPDVGKTEAKAEIWQRPDDFKAKTADFQVKAGAFNAAAKSGNVGSARAAFGDLGKTCKACHDPYREEH